MYCILRCFRITVHLWFLSSQQITIQEVESSPSSSSSFNSNQPHTQRIHIQLVPVSSQTFQLQPAEQHEKQKFQPIGNSKQEKSLFDSLRATKNTETPIESTEFNKVTQEKSLFSPSLFDTANCTFPGSPCNFRVHFSSQARQNFAGNSQENNGNQGYSEPQGETNSRNFEVNLQPPLQTALNDYYDQTIPENSEYRVNSPDNLHSGIISADSIKDQNTPGNPGNPNHQGSVPQRRQKYDLTFQIRDPSTPLIDRESLIITPSGSSSSFHQGGGIINSQRTSSGSSLPELEREKGDSTRNKDEEGTRNSLMSTPTSTPTSRTSTADTVGHVEGHHDEHPGLQERHVIDTRETTTEWWYFITPRQRKNYWVST